MAAVVHQMTDRDLDEASMAAQVLARIGRLAWLANDVTHQILASEGLGAGEFDTLHVLHAGGRPFRSSVKELSRSLWVTPGAVTKRVDRLSASGLVTRVVSERDARGRVVTLTEAGRLVIERLLAKRDAEQVLFLRGLSDTQRKELDLLLARLLISVE